LNAREFFKIEYFIHFSFSLLLLARWNHKNSPVGYFFVPRERADATKQYREIFFRLYLLFFDESILLQGLYCALYTVGCVHGRLIAAAADGNVCLLMLMPHRPGKKNPKFQQPSHHINPDKRNIHVAYRRARAEMVAPSIIHRYVH
jgi:hypothetical protein